MKKHLLSSMLMAIAVAAFSTPVRAQAPWFAGGGTAAGGLGNAGYGTAAGGGGYGGWGGYGLGYGLGGYYSPQTSYSAEYNGMANMIRAQGMYNADTAKAMISYEQARAQYMENQRNFMSAHMSRVRLAKAEEVKAHEEVQASQAKLDQYTASERPHALSQSQLDPKTGHITWPKILTTLDFDDYRKELEKLFDERAKYGQNSDLANQITKKTGMLKDALRAQILTLPLNEYSEARKFLDSMSATVR